MGRCLVGRQWLRGLYATRAGENSDARASASAQGPHPVGDGLSDFVWRIFLNEMDPCHSLFGQCRPATDEVEQPIKIVDPTLAKVAARQDSSDQRGGLSRVGSAIEKPARWMLARPERFPSRRMS